MTDITRLCHCGHMIEDRGMPRMSGPEYPLWIHLHSGSSQCDDGRFASPSTVADRANARHVRPEKKDNTTQ